MYKITSPYHFRQFANPLIPIFGIATLVLLVFAIYQALYISPADYQQGNMVRIMYIHVPAAWMSLGIYIFIGCCSFCNLVWKARLPYILAISAAPIGASFAFITLVTGSIWGKPIWGTWWVWDARLTSMLVLFLLYLSYIAVYSSGTNITRAEKPAGVIGLMGLINVPIVKFSVDLWYSLHQPASILRSKGVSIDTSMLIPLFSMFAVFILYFLLVLVLRANYLTQLIKLNIRGGSV